jgi:LuxR family transcriptional regulator, maltose regulon positive regulatory protein
MQLILDKITVPAQLPPISRQRLLKTLHSSLASCNLTIINGRTGTGKTLLATDFAWYSGRRVCWYKVDASDSNPVVFFQYLLASIRQQHPDFCPQWTEEFLQTVRPATMPQLAEAFVYELLENLAEPLLIVIDDFHLICDAEWVVPFFSRVAPLLPAEAHLMMIGRILPPAPLWRMRSKQTLCVIDESSLAFTIEETKKLLNIFGLSEIFALEAFRQTRGQAAKLRDIARLWMTGSGSPPLVDNLPLPSCS